jgi:two-component system OmpR family response regulator
MPKEQRPRILLVDDEESIRSTVSMFLQLSGIDVIAASNGVEAIAQVARQTPDLIVLEIGRAHV